MQTLRSAAVPLLILLSLPALAAPKSHFVSLGAAKIVPFVAADATAEEKSVSSTTLRIRPILVDGRVKDWAVGDAHEITERTYVIRRALHLNDTLPGDKGARWTWQPGPWIAVDKSSGHTTTLHLPDFDGAVSEVVWFRDFAAYCGIHTTAKAGNLMAVVWQIGSRRAAVQKPLAKWPTPERSRPVCAPAQWHREPMRVTLQPTGSQAVSFDIVGTTSFLDESDAEDDLN